jgi:hypothetical protein
MWVVVASSNSRGLSQAPLEHYEEDQKIGSK